MGIGRGFSLRWTNYNQYRLLWEIIWHHFINVNIWLNSHLDVWQNLCIYVPGGMCVNTPRSTVHTSKPESTLNTSTRTETKASGRVLKWTIIKQREHSCMQQDEPSWKCNKQTSSRPACCGGSSWAQKLIQFNSALCEHDLVRDRIMWKCRSRNRCNFQGETASVPEGRVIGERLAGGRLRCNWGSWL